MGSLVAFVLMLAIPAAVYGVGMFELGRYAPAWAGLPVAVVGSVAIPLLMYVVFVWRMS